MWTLGSPGSFGQESTAGERAGKTSLLWASRTYFQRALTLATVDGDPGNAQLGKLGALTMPPWRGCRPDAQKGTERPCELQASGTAGHPWALGDVPIKCPFSSPPFFIFTLIS